MGTKLKAAQKQCWWRLGTVEREIPGPGVGQVRVKVEACGICHGDALVKDSVWPGVQYPRVPRHEIAERIDTLGSNVSIWQEGQRVGVGWHGGHCFVCEHAHAATSRCASIEKSPELTSMVGTLST